MAARLSSLILPLPFALATACLHASASAQVANFENLPAGNKGGEFVDPASGIRFTSSSTNLKFVVADATPGDSPQTVPSRHLTGFPFAQPQGNVTMSAYFDFTLLFPSNISNFKMDYLSRAGDLRLDLYNAAGTLIGTPTYTVQTGSYTQTNISFTRPTADVRSIHVVPQTYMYSALDNIIVSPEPATFTTLAAVAILLRRRRRG